MFFNWKESFHKIWDDGKLLTEMAEIKVRIEYKNKSEINTLNKKLKEIYYNIFKNNTS